MSTHEHLTNAQEAVSILHELNLGQHALFIMSDGSLGILANGGYAMSFADHELRLDAEEAYRLFCILQAFWQNAQREE